MRDIDKLFLVFLAMCCVVLWMGSVLDRGDTYQPQFAINETYVKAIEEELARNLTIHIAENNSNVIVVRGNRIIYGPEIVDHYLDDSEVIIIPDDGRNVTIWKGDEVVCYIPR